MIVHLAIRTLPCVAQGAERIFTAPFSTESLTLNFLKSKTKQKKPTKHQKPDLNQTFYL